VSDTRSCSWRLRLTCILICIAWIVVRSSGHRRRGRLCACGAGTLSRCGMESLADCGLCGGVALCLSAASVVGLRCQRSRRDCCTGQCQP
jgi:hypothetical protein